MTENNAAFFSINGRAASELGYIADYEEVLTLTLEESPSTALSVRYEVYSPDESSSPLASKGAPVIEFEESEAYDVVPLLPNDEVTLTMPVSDNRAHSWMVRATATTAHGPEVYERLVVVRALYTTPNLRKTVPGETTQYEARGHSDTLNDMVDALAAVVGSNVNSVGAEGLTPWGGDVKLYAGPGISLADGTHGVRISNTGVLSLAKSGETGLAGDLTFIEGTNMSITQSASGWTFNCTASGGTTYTAGTGLNLSSNEFSLSHLGIQNLSSPGADRLMGWDQSAGATKWFTMGGGFVIDGTSVSVSPVLNQYAIGFGSASNTLTGDKDLLSFTWSGDPAVYNLLIGSPVPSFVGSKNYSAVIAGSLELAAGQSLYADQAWGLNSNIAGEGSDVYLYADFGYPYGAGQHYVGMATYVEATGLEAYFSATTEGQGYLVGRNSNTGSQVLVNPIDVWLRDSNFDDSVEWGLSNGIQLTTSGAQIDELFYLGGSMGPYGERSIAGYILTAALLPEGSIAFGDASDYQYGDASRLSFGSETFAGWVPLNYDVIGMGGVGIGSVNSSTVGGSGDWLVFKDSYSGSSGHVFPALPFSYSGELASAVTAFGNTSSLIGMLLTLYDGGGGSLQASYELGRTISMNETMSGPVTITAPSGYSSSPLVLNVSDSGNASEALQIYNNCSWSTTGPVEPFGIFFSGNAGDQVTGATEYSLGHRIWTYSDSIAFGKSITDSGYESEAGVWVREYHSASDNRAHYSSLIARSPYSGGFAKRAECRTFVQYNDGVPNTPAVAGFRLTANDTGYLAADLISIYGMKVAAYGDHDTASSSSGSIALSLLGDKQFIKTTMTENITEVEFTGGAGGQWFDWTVYGHASTNYSVTGFVNTSSDPCVTWMEGGDPDTTPVIIPAGGVANFHFVYDYGLGTYLGWVSVNDDATVVV